MRESDLLRSIVKNKGSVDMAVLGASMGPSLAHGDKVRLSRPADFEVGGLAAFPGLRSGKPVLHRVVEVGEDFVVLVGDNGFVSTHVDHGRLIGIASHIRFSDSSDWHPIVTLPEAAAIAEMSLALSTAAPCRVAHRRAKNSMVEAERARACERWRSSLIDERHSGCA